MATDDVVEAISAAKDELGVDDELAEDNAGVKVETAPEEVKEEPAEEPEEKADEGPTEEAKPEEKPETKEEEEEDEPFNLSAKDLEAINADPKLQAAYKSMQRGFTRKMQGLSEEAKGLRTAHETMEWVRANKREAIRVLAEQEGIKIPGITAEAVKEEKTAAEVADDIESTLMEQWTAKVGKEAAELLVPLVMQTAKQISSKTVSTEIEPLRAEAERLASDSTRNSISAQVSRFGAFVQENGGEWTDEVVQAMADKMQVVHPQDSADPQAFLREIYNSVMFERGQSSAKREQLKRLRQAKSSSEPTSTVRPAGKATPEITEDMSERDAIALAVKMANEQLAEG